MLRPLAVLQLLLRLGGLLTLSAVFAVFLPWEWMVTTHRWLGMGELPRAPVVDYMARSLSALYAFHGGLLLAIATDPLRHAPLVRYVGWANVALGAALAGIDLHAGLPAWWVLAEGPWVLAAGVLVLVLLGRAEADAQR